jgi:hypothetical protein
MVGKFWAGEREGGVWLAGVKVCGANDEMRVRRVKGRAGTRLSAQPYVAPAQARWPTWICGGQQRLPRAPSRPVNTSIHQYSNTYTNYRTTSLRVVRYG